MSKCPSAFTSFKLGAIECKNRLALAPMTRARTPSHVPNSNNVEYYAQRASAGLVITEGTHISPYAVGWVDVPGIYTEEQATAWKAVTDAVHARGGAIYVQLWHQGRQSHSSFMPDGKPPFSASDVPLEAETHAADYTKKPAEVPRPMAQEDIDRTIEEFKNACRLADKAGFDGVEIHNANGYLLDQFLQSKTNKRTDEYGGSVENRFRFSRQVISACVEVLGAKRVGIRFSPNGVFGEMGSPDFRETFEYAIAETGKFDLAYIHVMDGLAFGFHELGDPFTMADARKLVPPTVALVANCGHNEEATERLIAAGDADLVAIGRPWIGNPNLAEQWKRGEAAAVEVPMKYWYSPTKAGDEEYAEGVGYNKLEAVAA